MIGNPKIIPHWPMARGRRLARTVQSGSRRWWLIAPAACAILTSGGVAAQDLALIEEDRRIFFEETFNGNGRTCGTCHPATHNFTIDAEFIARLPDNDPLFVAENFPELAGLENPVLMRTRGRILENLNGFESAPVFRGVPHNIGMRVSIDADPAQLGPGRDAVGWSGDGAPAPSATSSEARSLSISRARCCAGRASTSAYQPGGRSVRSRRSCSRSDARTSSTCRR
jgi:hypothetical protein